MKDYTAITERIRVLPKHYHFCVNIPVLTRISSVKAMFEFESPMEWLLLERSVLQVHEKHDLWLEERSDEYFG
ncbi:hypothetical protein VroAM7_31500 [Vibrio rotiferianus]|uniref:Uncharacterized protein n=1 Tax=Vibrio rotiferianus TaxID=190895 RepID=A0A510IAB4_9VIBR|nr:hypothetical protein VroAM7_31500 [Vibrio rotiferianus]